MEAFLCNGADLAEGASRGFDPLETGQDSVLLVRRNGRVHAYRDLCPHYGETPMAWRKDQYLTGDKLRIACHAHGAQFDIETGLCVLGPCLGQSLRAVALREDEQGRIFLIEVLN